MIFQLMKKICNNIMRIANIPENQTYDDGIIQKILTTITS